MQRLEGRVSHFTKTAVFVQTENGIDMLQMNTSGYPIKIGDILLASTSPKGKKTLSEKDTHCIYSLLPKLEHVELALLERLDDHKNTTEEYVRSTFKVSAHSSTMEVTQHVLESQSCPIFVTSHMLSTIAECYTPSTYKTRTGRTPFYFQMRLVQELLGACNESPEKCYTTLNSWCETFRARKGTPLSDSDCPLSNKLNKMEEKKFFRLWYQNVMERAVRLFNTKSKEIYQTGYPVTELPTVLLERPHVLISIEEHIIKRLMRTLGFSETDETRVAREILHFLEKQAQDQLSYGVHLRELLRSYKSKMAVTSVLAKNRDIESVALPPCPAEFGLPDIPKTTMLLSKRNYHVSAELASLLGRMNREPAYYNAGTVRYRSSKLDDIQKGAVRGALKHNLYFITGYAGTGKTTVIKEITDNLTAWQLPWLCLAFTGIATHNVRRIVNTEHTSTIDLLLANLERKVGIKEFRALRHIIIDEATMTSNETMRKLMKALYDYEVKAKITLIGDPHQLEAIGRGCFFEAIVRYKLTPGTTLTRVYRTEMSPENALYASTSAIAEGKGAELTYGPEFSFFEGNESKVYAMARSYARQGDMNDMAVLTPYAEAARRINKQLQLALNPQGQKIAATGFRIGDKVMMTVNDHNRKVFNGSQGVIVAATTREVLVDFSTVRLKFDLARKTGSKSGATGTTADLDLAYAMTVHKAQGMEWKCVICYFPRSATPSAGFLNKRLLYTLLTRASDMVVVIGFKKRQIEIMARTNSTLRLDPLPGMPDMIGAAN